MYFIAIRESQANDTPALAALVRQAYISNVSKAFIATLFNEITFQAIILLAAFMFIFMGVPLHYCLSAIPTVLISLYILIYSSFLMKAAELVYSKRPLQCWVAEAYEPYFFTERPQSCFYTITNEPITDGNYRRKIIGTCSASKHQLSEDGIWLFRLAVDQRYRGKGVGSALTQAVLSWGRSRRFDFIELVITECQDEARQLFANAGFEIKQMYHKRLVTGVFTMQMFQLRCEIRPTFK